jgi:asparagine synthase (glutamine-hydrolysing)
VSHIVGVFNDDGRPATLAELEQMSGVWGLSRSAAEDCWISGAFGIGVRPGGVPDADGGHQPVIAGSRVAAFDGRLDDREELAEACGLVGRGWEGLSDSALALAAYERLGERWLAHLNGDFALALFDGTRQRLVLARDAMAARCLYYCPLQGTLLFASEIKALIAHPQVSPRPDEDGLADLVLNNWTDERRTCFEGIFSVPPGHQVIATPAGLETRPHRTFNPGREIKYGSFAEYCESFGSLFERAVRRRLRGAAAVAVAVSGGVDSSSIFCQGAALVERERLGVTVRGVSMTFPDGTAADEKQYLDRIEEIWGRAIDRVPVSSLRFLVESDELVRHLEMPGVVWPSFDDLIERARLAGCRVMMHGFFADQMLFERGYLVDLVRCGRWLKVRHDIRQFPAWITDVDAEFFANDFRSRAVRGLPPRWLVRFAKRRVARRRAAARYPDWFTKTFRERAYERQSPLTVPTRFASVHAEQCYRHATAGHYVTVVRRQRAACLMHGVDLRYPFRDRDLVEFLMAVPGDIVNWKGVPKGLLREALRHILPEPIRNRRWKADSTLLDHQAALRNHADVVGLLSPDALSIQAGFVDADMLRRSARAGATSPRRDMGVRPGWEPSDLAGLELWLRHFFGGRKAAAQVA